MKKLDTATRSLIPYEVSIPTFQGQYVDAETAEPNLVISIELATTKTFPIVPSSSGEPRNGYQIGSLEADPQQVRISGPESVVNSIDKVVARAKLYVDTLEIKDSNIENAYGFEKKQFKNLTYDIWKWIGKSADNNRNVRERAEANYQMAKLLYKTEKGSDKVMSSLFDFCAGYGYKPFRIIRTSGIMVLINTFMFSFMKFVEILSKMWSIPLNEESFCKGAIIVWNYFLISIAALAGQNSFELRDGLPYWLSVIEYLLGVVLFAMFVNALYARYKE